MNSSQSICVKKKDFKHSNSIESADFENKMYNLNENNQTREKKLTKSLNVKSSGNNMGSKIFLFDCQ